MSSNKAHAVRFGQHCLQDATLYSTSPSHGYGHSEARPMALSSNLRLGLGVLKSLNDELGVLAAVLTGELFANANGLNTVFAPGLDAFKAANLCDGLRWVGLRCVGLRLKGLRALEGLILRVCCTKFLSDFTLSGVSGRTKGVSAIIFVLLC